MIDLTGEKFGLLTVLGPTGQSTRKRRWYCRCDCGRITEVQQGNLQSGHSRSCGCQKPRGTKHPNYKHGARHDRTYFAWKRMRQRCWNPRDRKYADYGGRGITICAEWNDYTRFLQDMGECPKGLSLGRIDNDGPYCASNCRWETPYQQANNTRKNHFITFQGKTQTVSQWARDIHVPYKRLWQQVRCGAWPAKEARKGQGALFQ